MLEPNERGRITQPLVTGVAVVQHLPWPLARVVGWRCGAETETLIDTERETQTHRHRQQE